MVAKITEIINDELSRAGEADGNRVPILGVMADVRGTLGLSLANIRAYLLTGDPKFAEKFDKLWAKNEVRFKMFRRFRRCSTKRSSPLSKLSPRTA